MKSMTEASAEYFERVASKWDSLRTGYFSEAVRDAAIAKAYLRPEMTVADIGSGTGFVAAGLAPLVTKVYAVDGAAAMLEVSKENLSQFSNVEYRLADGAALPFADGSLDAIFANMYLHHCPEPQTAIEEMVRVLKPGGRLVITDMDEHEHAWLREEMADVWLGFKRDPVRTWLREAGLVNVIVDSSQQTCSSSSQTKAHAGRADISIFLATGTRRVQVREHVQTRYGETAERVTAGQACCGKEAETTPAGSEIIPLSNSCCSPAASATASCCSPAPNAMPEVGGSPAGATFIWDTGYSQDQLGTIPAEAASLALGCGNPTAFASLKPGETVLDIGSGGGIDAFFAAQRVGPAGRVIGVDMTPQMLERARATAARSKATNVEFREGHAEALPVEDGTVDVIMSNCVINLCEDKGQVFEEAYRVLKPGGRLAISDTVVSSQLPEAIRLNSDSWGACVSGALPEQEYLDLVRAAGFRDIRGERSLSRGTLGDVEMYSLSVTAVK